MKSVYDQVFNLKYYAGFSIFESWNMPIGLRNYWTREVIKKLEQEKEAMEKVKNKK